MLLAFLSVGVNIGQDILPLVGTVVLPLDPFALSVNTFDARYCRPLIIGIGPDPDDEGGVVLRILPGDGGNAVNADIYIVFLREIIAVICIQPDLIGPLPLGALGASGSGVGIAHLVHITVAVKIRRHTYPGFHIRILCSGTDGNIGDAGIRKGSHGQDEDCRRTEYSCLEKSSLHSNPFPPKIGSKASGFLIPGISAS